MLGDSARCRRAPRPHHRGAVAMTGLSTGGATLTFKGKIVDADHVQGDVDFGDQGGATFSGERK